jgi:glycosyltransferase involved in cell wall biosynthesis
MPPITAILHTYNDELRLGRALQTLLPCDEILIIDHGSTDNTLRIARQYAARIGIATKQAPGGLLHFARHDWALVLQPSESVSEPLEAALFEWKLSSPSDLDGIPAFSVPVREQTSEGWIAFDPATRLIPRTWNRWEGLLPANHLQAKVLSGELLRFRRP